jgi:hypothetical protein
MKKYVLVALALFLVACSGMSESQRLERDATERNQKTINIAQPVPSFDYSQQRDILIQIYKISNEARNTWSVPVSDYGQPVGDVCPSIGFPIPGGTQLTNPMQVVNPYSGEYVVVPQAEPNGLYSDPNTNSTWILCVDPDGTVAPVYSEHKVMTYPWPVEVKDGKVVRVAGGKATFNVTVKKP